MNRRNIKKIEEIKTLLETNRVNILTLLYKKDTCVCQMVDKLNLKHSLLSHHLKVLQRLGYISKVKNGQHIIYQLDRSKRNTIKNIFKLISE